MRARERPMGDYLFNLARQIVTSEATVWPRPAYRLAPHTLADGLDSPFTLCEPQPSVAAPRSSAGGSYRAESRGATATSPAADPSVGRQNDMSPESPAPRAVTGGAPEPTPAVPGAARAEAPALQRNSMEAAAQGSSGPPLTEATGSASEGTPSAAVETRVGRSAVIEVKSLDPSALASTGRARAAASHILDASRVQEPATYEAVPVAAKVSRDKPLEPRLMRAGSAVGVMPRLPAAAWPRASVAGDAEAPTVHVTIGRVEVRVGSPAAVPSRRPGTTPKPALSLSDYLRRRNGGLP